jgi:hypothetical protein
MSLLCPIENLKENQIIVLCDSEISKKAHRELFHYGDNFYKLIEDYDVFHKIEEILNLLNSDSLNLLRIHVAFNWNNLLKISLWQKKEPTMGDLFLWLKGIGSKIEELENFKKAHIRDVFFYFYYGKKFDTLRKVCHSAKRQIEKHLNNSSIKVESHLVAEDTKRIVASSL